MNGAYVSLEFHSKLYDKAKDTCRPGGGRGPVLLSCVEQ